MIQMALMLQPACMALLIVAFELWRNSERDKKGKIWWWTGGVGTVGSGRFLAVLEPI